MGLLVLKVYYIAVVIDQLKSWFQKPTIKPWCQIEHMLMNNKSPLSLLMATNLPKTSHLLNHPTIQAAIQAWNALNPKGTEKYLTTRIPIPLESLWWMIPNPKAHTHDRTF